MKKNTTFEETIVRLQQIEEKLQNPQTGLEESLALYEEGCLLLQHGSKILDTAQQRILKIQTISSKNEESEDE